MLCPVTMLNPMLLAIQASAAACAVDAAINTRADPIHAPIDTTPERLTRTSFELNQEGSVFRRDFDPDNLASDELWNVHVGKGEKFTCRMKATDAGAGWLIGDQRKPPSAVSPWKGDLKSKRQIYDTKSSQC